MSGFLEKYNTDDVFLRSLIIGFVRSLNDLVTYKQVNDKQEMLEIYIPFLYSLSGDESFLQDQFLEYVDCDGNLQFAEGNYDIVPRGVVVLNSASIDASALTSKFVRTTYTKESEQGEMKSFSAFTNNIPISLDFSVKIRVDTMLDSFKVFQSVIDALYKVNSYNFEFEGVRVPVQIGFPEQYQNDKQFEFTYGSTQKWIEIEFSVVGESYFPQRDKSTERFRGNLMQAGIKVQNKIGSDLSSNSSLI
jgi:hypothetical protein